METIFENKTIITREVLTEFSQKTFKICSIGYRIFVLAFSLIFALLAVLELINEGLSVCFIILCLGSVLLIFMFFKGYLVKINKGLKNLQGLYGELPEITSNFYEEKMDTITAISTLTIEYNKITKIAESENLYLLMIGKQCIILNKTGFTIGDFASFKSFIEDKVVFSKQVKN